MEIIKTKVNIPSKIASASGVGKVNPAIIMAPHKPDRPRVCDMLEYVMPAYTRFYLYDREADELHKRLYRSYDLIAEIYAAMEGDNISIEQISRLDVIPVEFDEDKLLQEFEPVFTEAFPLMDMYEVVVWYKEEKDE